jgi:hypothetical protein
MTRTRTAIMLTATTVLLLAPTTSARAGGWTSLQPERRDYLPGEQAELAARFSSRIDYGGSVDQGPYVAWLLRGASYGLIDPPRIPEGAIRLGVLQLKQPAPHSKWLDASARLSFTVPNLPSGDYGIGICNEPCGQSGVGDLNGGRIRIVHTPLEGQLMSRVEGLETEARKARYQLRKSERRLEKVQSALQASTREQGLTDRVAELETQLQAVRARPTTISRPLLRGWAVIVLAGLVVAFVLGSALRRRRRVKPRAQLVTPGGELPKRETVSHR